MRDDIKAILTRFGDFLAGALILAALIGIVLLDISSNRNVGESYVEFAQEGILLITTIIFAASAVRQRAGGLWLVAGFFCCMLIRELDEYFDMIAHGAWKYFALLVFVGVVAQAWRLGKENTVHTLANFMKSRAYAFVCMGLVIVLIYSRLYGMTELWQLLMGENYIRLVKIVSEECTELLGYGMVLWGSLTHLLSNKEH